MAAAINWITFLIVTILWCIFGTAVWLWLIIRFVGIYSFELLVSSIARGNPKKHFDVERVSSYWVDGFNGIRNSIFHNSSKPTFDQERSIRTFIYDFAFGILFWLPILNVFGILKFPSLKNINPKQKDSIILQKKDTVYLTDIKRDTIYLNYPTEEKQNEMVIKTRENTPSKSNKRFIKVKSSPPPKPRYTGEVHTIKE